MATLRGQNLRIYKVTPGTPDDVTVIAMATNCTVQLNSNANDASHKDIVGMFSHPTVDGLSWQVSVESLDVLDMATWLTAIKSLTPMTIAWEESSTDNNQYTQSSTFGRKGQAYVADVQFAFNNRENSTKNVQFQGTGALAALSSPDETTVDTFAYTKGETVRLFLGSDNTAVPAKCVAAATQLSVHVSCQFEDSTTKDTASGKWLVQEPTGISYDISTTALVRSSDNITSAVLAQDLGSIESIYEAGNPVKFQVANVSGANNRTKGSVLISGSVIIQSLSLQAPNRQKATYTAQLQGVGAYNVGA